MTQGKWYVILRQRNKLQALCINTLQKEIDELTTKNNELEDKLTEARNIISNLIRVTYGEGWTYSYSWKVKAEQFLEEVDK